MVEIRLPYTYMHISLAVFFKLFSFLSLQTSQVIASRLLLISKQWAFIGLRWSQGDSGRFILMGYFSVQALVRRLPVQT